MRILVSIGLSANLLFVLVIIIIFVQDIHKEITKCREEGSTHLDLSKAAVSHKSTSI